MTDVMISYARADAVVAELLATRLTSAGFNVWFDRDIVPGETFDQVIDRALRDARRVVVLWSRQSVGSRWVVGEAQEAAALAKLVPARLDDSVIPLEFRRIQTADLIGWRGETKHAGYRSLVTSLRNGGPDAARQVVRKKESAPRTSPRTGGHPLAWFLAIVLAVAVVVWWNGQVDGGSGDGGRTNPSSTTILHSGLFDETLLSAPFETSGNFIGESGPGPEIIATRIIEDWLATSGCDGASRGEIVSVTSGDPAAVTLDISIPCADTPDSLFPYSGGFRLVLTISGGDGSWEVTREMWQVYCPRGIEEGALCRQ